MGLDLLYLLGLLIVWYGNIDQMRKVLRTKSTKSLSMLWVLAIFFSIGVRLPRAVTSTYWIWQWGYIISFFLMAALVVVVLYYRKHYPRR